MVWPPTRTGANISNFFYQCGTSTADPYDSGDLMVCMVSERDQARIAAFASHRTPPLTRPVPFTQYFNEGAQIGCNESTATTDVMCGSPPGGDYSSEPCCDTLMEPTLNDPALLTYEVSAGSWDLLRPAHAP